MSNRSVDMHAARAMRRRKSALSRIVAAAWPVAALAIALGAGNAHAQRFIVVSSGHSTANAQALAAIREHAGWTVDARRLGDDDAALAALLTHAAGGTAIVALGTKASQLVGALAVAVPAVDCMVQGDLGIASAAPVVPLAIPVDVQIRWMKRLLPAAHRIALLYDPAQNERTAADIAEHLKAAGYIVMSEAVASPQALPPALARLGDADALLALPDSTVYSPALAKGLLLFTYRTNTPLIALSDAWVRAGALYAIEWNYSELGTYCAELALHLASTAKNARPPTLPAPLVSVNQRAATQLRLKWDAASLAGVGQVHE
ncbi:MAG: ABC transporter substrate binding protein [Casimicrobiaceae bacterium]